MQASSSTNPIKWTIFNTRPGISKDRRTSAVERGTTSRPCPPHPEPEGPQHVGAGRLPPEDQQVRATPSGPLLLLPVSWGIWSWEAAARKIEAGLSGPGRPSPEPQTATSLGRARWEGEADPTVSWHGSHSWSKARGDKGGARNEPPIYVS